MNLNDIFSFIQQDQSEIGIANQIKSFPYQHQVWIYACISLITNNLSSLGKYILNTRTNEKIESHPALDLLDFSNAEVFGDMLLQNIIVNMLLDGQMFILPDDHQYFNRGQVPVAIYPTQDKYIEAKLNNFNIIDTWVYNPSSGKQIEYNAGQVIRINFYNPYNKAKGLAPIQAVLHTIFQDANTVAFINSFFKNNCQIAGVLSTDKTLTKEQAEFISSQFAQKYSGLDNGFKTPVLHSGLEYKAIASTFKDMQFQDQQEYIKERILAAFKVPKSLVADYSEVNYSNSVTAKQTFWKEGLMPIDSIINEAFTYQWIRKINPDWKLVSDYSKIEELQEVQNDKINAYKTLIDTGLPREEASRILNIPIDWENVEELEAEVEPVEEPVSDTSAAPIEDELEEDTEDDEKFVKTLKSKMNSYFTSLRNKCLDIIDAGKEIELDFDIEFQRLKSITDEIYNEFNFNDNIKKKDTGFKMIIESLSKNINNCNNDKRLIHEVFQRIYKLNKDFVIENLSELKTN